MAKSSVKARELNLKVNQQKLDITISYINGRWVSHAGGRFLGKKKSELEEDDRLTKEVFDRIPVYYEISTKSHGVSVVYPVYDNADANDFKLT